MVCSEFPPGAAQLQLADGVAVLRPTEAVFAAMLTGWSRQQLARNLSPGTIAARVSVIRRVQLFCGTEGPWIWTPAQADDWVAELREIDGAAHSTVLGYQGAIRQFMAYLTDPAYGWIPQCEKRFGTHPVQTIYEANAVIHVQEGARGPLRGGHSVRCLAVTRHGIYTGIER